MTVRADFEKEYGIPAISIAPAGSLPLDLRSNDDPARSADFDAGALQRDRYGD